MCLPCFSLEVRQGVVLIPVFVPQEGIIFHHLCEEEKSTEQGRDVSTAQASPPQILLFCDGHNLQSLSSVSPLGSLSFMFMKNFPD